MVTNPLTVDFSGFSPRREFVKPTFGQTLKASIGYTYDPIIESIRAQNQFGNERQEGYNPFNDLGSHGLFAMHLRHATNPQHMAFLKRGIDESIQRRQVLADSSFTALLGAGLFDPLNLVALPLGGPSIGIGRSALRVGAGVGMLQAGVEAALIQPNDPVQTATESMYNIVGAALFGAAFGGAISIPLTARAKALRKAQEDLTDFARSVRMIEHASELSADDLGDLSNAIRPHENLNIEILKSSIEKLSKRKDQLEIEMNAGKTTGKEAEFREVENSLSSHRREAAIRELIAEGYTPEKLWNIASNRFTDSIFYKFVSTPFKRVIQSDTATGSMKEAMVKLGGDSGLNYIATTLGFASPLSVYQRAAAKNGLWVKAHDDLIKLFREDMNLMDTSFLDIDVVTAYRSVTRRDDSYGSWLRGINRKRTLKEENLTDVEKQAISVIDNFFKKAESELKSVGLIGTKKSIQDSINYFNRTIPDLDDQIARASTPIAKENLIRYKERLQSRKEIAEQELRNFSDTEQTFTDNFLPRFWDTAVVKKRRNELENIIARWYTNNPTVWRFENGKWVQKKFSPNADDIKERAKQTVDNILNDPDPTSDSSIAYGYGRSKHFRHRKLDIPNELVWDFIMQDPIAIMKTYTARVAPRIEFKKVFNGQELEDINFHLRRDAIQKGLSEKEINKHMRDINLMYDRIAGAVLRNPSAINQKTAYIMKEAAATNYMGSGWIAAVPEFGRVMMEHDGQTMIKVVSALLDKETLKMGAKDVRLSGEAIDILKGSAFARLVDDMANNVDANEFWNKARNAFYTLNGLGPITQLSKTLDGIARGHTIIDRSIKLTNKKATAFEKQWLARYGIDDNKAKKIANSSWEQTNNGLYLANTEQWGKLDIKQVTSQVRKTYKIPDKPIFKMTEKELFNRFKDEFDIDRIVTNQKEVDAVWKDLGKSKSVMGTAIELPNGTHRVYLNRRNMKAYYDAFETRGKVAKEERKADLVQALATGLISETQYYHALVKIEKANQIKSFDDYVRFVALHELHHTKFAINEGERLPNYEKRIDDLAFAYMKDERNFGIKLAAEKRMKDAELDAEDVVSTFRSALNSGILNTILAATPADRPIINDGVVFVPHHIAKRFGYAEDKMFKGYSRIENGFLALPFQFYSYTLANVNKMVGAMAHGQLKNRALGITTMLGLGYLSTQMRYSISGAEFAWDEMSAQDRFARAWDASGITALYSDLFYQTLHTSLALGGPNITNGVIAPKFPHKPSFLAQKLQESTGIIGLDAAANMAGAGASISLDLADGAVQFLAGEYGEGAKKFARNLPFARMWFWKDDMNAITRMWAQ
tara:strand:+ start:11394 stop:15392 length:3999 start_codon:yes stop_codon:yes gene_type:complete